jgi:hypothetical protein
VADGPIARLNVIIRDVTRTPAGIRDTTPWPMTVVCYDDISTTLEELPLESNATAVAIQYSLPSCPIRFPYLHTCIPFISPRCVCITHSARHLTRKCRLLHHGYKAVADDSWRNCRLLHHGRLLAQVSSARSRI